MRNAALGIVFFIGLLAPGVGHAVQYVTGTSARFAWTPAWGPVVGYVVRVSRNGGPFEFLRNTGASETQVTITGAIGERVRIQVLAWSDVEKGPVSPVSEEVAFVTAPPPSLSNPSFEQGPSWVDRWLTLPAGSSRLTGWQIVGDSVDVVDDALWLASSGRRSLDLAGLGLGGIRQTFDTVPGQAYVVTFDAAANPGGPNPLRWLVVSAGGPSGIYALDATASSRPNLPWTRHTFDFVAVGSRTTLEFRAYGADTAWGPTLDNVRIDLDLTP